jgi:hypothetical protein
MRARDLGLVFEVCFESHDVPASKRARMKKEGERNQQTKGSRAMLARRGDVRSGQGRSFKVCAEAITWCLISI